MPNKTLCLDIGGTKTAIALFNDKGKIIKKEIILTCKDRQASCILNNMFKTIEQMLGKERVRAIGIGIAGVVDPKNHQPINLKKFSTSFQKTNIKKIFEKKYKTQVFIENDATLFTYAEHKIGQAKGYQNVIGLTLGTGIGGGIIINGKIYNGKNGFASEFGHIILEEESDLPCSCGKFGHFEALSSGTGMINIFKKFTGLATGQTKDTFEIEKLAKQKDIDAVKTLSLMARYLGAGIASLIHCFDPDIVIIGGGQTRIKILWDKMLPEIKKRLIDKRLEKTKILKSKMEDDAVLYGAYYLTK